MRLDQEKSKKKGPEGKLSWWKGRFKWLERLRRQESSKQPDINYEIYYLSLSEWILYSMIGAVLSGVIAYTFYRSIPLFFLLLPVGLCYPLYKRNELKKIRQQTLNWQFKEAIMILAAALSAGYSVENAYIVSLKELRLLYGEQALITGEFSYMAHQMKMNQPVEQVLFQFAKRSAIEDVKNFAEVFSVAKRSGGELVAIINHTALIIHDKVQVKEEIITLTASKKFEQKIMNMIPFFFVFYIDLTSPGFFGLMYETGLGRAIMSVCLVIYLGAYWLSERILAIEV